jgi:hypothetical protein
MIKMADKSIIDNVMTKETAIELEKKLVGIRSVFDAHVDIDEQGEVVAIGIFSDVRRPAKEIKRDVEETFRRIAGFRVNHNKISIVEQKLEANDQEKRVKFISAYQIQKGNGFIEGVVTLDFNGTPIEETLEVQQYEMDLEYLIASVTGNAIMRIIPEYRVRIDHVREVSMGSTDVICVTLSVISKVNGTGGMYVGSVVKSKDLISSVSKATLDALNRRLDSI